MLDSYGVPASEDTIPGYRDMLADLGAAAREHLAAEAHPAGDVPGRGALTGTVGHLVLAVDLVKEYETTSWENPADGDCTWLTLSGAHVVAHDLDEHHLRWLADEATFEDIDTDATIREALRNLAGDRTGEDDVELEPPVDQAPGQVIPLFGARP